MITVTVIIITMVIMMIMWLVSRCADYQDLSHSGRRSLFDHHHHHHHHHHSVYHPHDQFDDHHESQYHNNSRSWVWKIMKDEEKILGHHCLFLLLCLCLDKYLKNSYWGAAAGKDYRYYRANLAAWTNRNIWFLYWRGDLGRRRWGWVGCRPRRSIKTIASFDQWSKTIENHWKRW